jgi:hypothetical protein
LDFRRLLGDLWGEQISRAPNPPYVFDGMLITKLTDDTQSSRASSPKIDDQDKKINKFFSRVRLKPQGLDTH